MGICDTVSLSFSHRRTILSSLIMIINNFHSEFDSCFIVQAVQAQILLFGGIQRGGLANMFSAWGTQFKNILFYFFSFFLQIQKSNVPSVQSTIYLCYVIIFTV